MVPFNLNWSGSIQKTKNIFTIQCTECLLAKFEFTVTLTGAGSEFSSDFLKVYLGIKFKCKVYNDGEPVEINPLLSECIWVK